MCFLTNTYHKTGMMCSSYNVSCLYLPITINSISSSLLQILTWDSFLCSRTILFGTDDDDAF